MERGSITLESCFGGFVNICCSTQTEIYLFIHSFIHSFLFLFFFPLDCLVKSEWCKDVKYGKDRIDSNRYVHECIPKPWQFFFKNLDEKLKNLANDLIKKGKQLNDNIEPQMPLLFKALELVNPEDVKVVILGQDPTPQKGKASGVAFHVKNPRYVPAVLHMFLEVAFEGFPVDLNNGDVTSWAEQGVLLLNTAFTCPHNPPSGAMDKAKYTRHFDIWKDFTKSLIRYIGGKKADPSAWLLWGSKAQGFSGYINKKHLVIEGGHPSPMGIATHGDSFFGGNYFNIANQFLEINYGIAIDWSLSNTGQNSLDFSLRHQTKIELQQQRNEAQQLRKQLNKKQKSIDFKELDIRKMQQRLEVIDYQLQNREGALNLYGVLSKKKLHNEKNILEKEYYDQLNQIHQKRRQLRSEKYQLSDIEEKFQQNQKNQHYLRGLPKDLLKRNFQKQINVIDEQLNQLR